MIRLTLLMVILGLIYYCDISDNHVLIFRLIWIIFISIGGFIFIRCKYKTLDPIYILFTYISCFALNFSFFMIIVFIIVYFIPNNTLSRAGLIALSSIFMYNYYSELDLFDLSYNNQYKGFALSSLELTLDIYSINLNYIARVF